MGDRTRFLSLFVLLAASFPGEVVRVFAYAKAATNRVQPTVGHGSLVVLSAIYLLTAGGGWVLQDLSTNLGWSAWVLGAILIGGVVPAIDVVVAMIVIRAQGKAIGSIRLSDDVSAGIVATSALLLVALSEELMFRVLIGETLVGPLGAPSWIAVGLPALIYAVGHWHYGRVAVLQRCLSGAMFGSLYLASGGHLWVPVAAHIAQNLVVAQSSRFRRFSP